MIQQDELNTLIVEYIGKLDKEVYVNICECLKQEPSKEMMVKKARKIIVSEPNTDIQDVFDRLETEFYL